MPSPEPSRIRYLNGTQVVAEVTCSADGVLAAVYDAIGQQLAYVQIAVDGSVVLTGQGAVVEIDASGRIRLAPMNGLVLQVPDADPHEAGLAYTDNGFLKVSAG